MIEKSKESAPSKPNGAAELGSAEPALPTCASTASGAELAPSPSLVKRCSKRCTSALSSPVKGSSIPASIASSSTRSSASMPPCSRGSSEMALRSGSPMELWARRASRSTRLFACTSESTSLESDASPQRARSSMNGRTLPNTIRHEVRPRACRDSITSETISTSPASPPSPMSSKPSCVNWRAAPELRGCARTSGAS